MMDNNLFTALGAVVALLLSGCAASGGAPGTGETSRDLIEMKERILELQEKTAMAEIELERLRQQVSSLERRLPESSSEGEPTSGRTEADEPPAAAARRLGAGEEPVVEEADLQEESLGRESLGSFSAQPPPSGRPPEPEVSPAAPAGPSERAAEVQPVEPAAQAVYDRGYTLFHQQRYLDAEASFQRFLQAYPGTELSDNAQFWIGESRFARGDIRGALAAFRETLERYPQGNKVPDALIKEGDCLAELGDRDGARDRYREVTRRFPNAAAALMAEERLAALD